MGAYNFKITEYAHGTKISHYARPIVTEHPREKREKTSESERTPEQIKHSVQ